MVRKKLAVAIASIGALQANLVSALGMGDFSLNSALNQPLEAEIRLLNTGDLDPSQVKVSLAGQDDFKNAGVARDYFLTNMRFSVELDQSGGGIIKVTTHDPVIEPYLNFLVETRWPTGRMLREYTVLLDLPVFSEAQAEPVTPSTSAAQVQPSTTRVVTQPAASTRVASSTSSRFEGQLEAGSKYRVKNDDTLWEIAAKSRAGGASVQQTMVGIQRLNPHAFINGNINRLKAGSVLRLPNTAEVNDISSKAAVKEVAQQNRAWRTGDTTSVAGSDSVGPQLDATSSSSDAAPARTDGARLSLASGGDSDSSAGGEGQGGSEALKDELNASLENLDKAKLENDELKSRIGDMEAKLATLQRLLELKDDELAALQGGAAETAGSESPAAAGGEGAAVGEPADALGEQPTEAAIADAGVAGQEATADASPEVGVVQPEPAKPAPAPQPQPEPQSEQELLDELLANPLYLGGAGALVLALAAVLLMRRRKEQEEAETFDSAIFDEADEVSSDVLMEPEVEPELDISAVEIEEDNEVDALVAELEEEIAQGNAEEAAAVEVEEPATPTTEVESETGDAIAEADIYMAYGRYQQAIDLLTTAVAKEPERADLRVKLLEVYIETRDKPAFQQQFVALQGLGDQGAINQIKETLSSVEGVSDWLEHLPGAEAAEFTSEDMDAELLDAGDDDLELELDEELDIDLDLDGLDSTQETEAIDLDLDLDDDSAEEEISLELDDELDLSLGEESADDASSELEGGDLELSLDEDLDLDLGDSPESSAEPAEEGDLDLDLGSLESESEAAEVSAEVEEVASEEGFDLDLDSESDLDLDLGELGDSDLSELEAEFGDSGLGGNETTDLNIESDLELDSAQDDGLELGESESAEAELDIKLDESLSELGEADLSDMDLDASGFDLSGELSGDLENLDISVEESEPGAEADDSGIDFSLDIDDAKDEAAAEQEHVAESAPTAASLDETMSAEPAGDDDFDFLADTDEVSTKLDLARAYIDMGDSEGAKDILDEVIQEGNDEQKQEANELLEKV